MRGMFFWALAMLIVPACGEEKREGGLSIPLEGAAALPAELPPVSGPAGRPLVVIDPGHGGSDPGALSPHAGLLEKDVTLELARAARKALLDSGRVRVALSREDDRAVPLRHRYEAARKLSADLFVSIHADAAARPEASGASIYTLADIASDADAARLAERENGSDLSGASAQSGEGAVNRILLDLARRESMERSAEFARLLHREASPLVPFQPDPHRFAALAVLRAPDLPSVLFETGYLTNEQDVAFLSSAEGRERIARGLRSAIETYLARERFRNGAR